MIMITINIDNEKMKLNNEVNSNKITSIDRNTKMHSIHDSEKMTQTIYEAQTDDENSDDDYEMIEEYLESEEESFFSESPSIHDSEKMIQTIDEAQNDDENSDDDYEMIEEYIESEEESFFSESPKENNKYLDTIMPTNENTKDLETIKQYNNLNAKFFEGFASVVYLTPEEAKKEVLLRKESNNYNSCPHKCDLCYRGFDSQVAFENHKKKHTDVYGVYECDLCHLRYNTKRYVSTHIHMCHKRKFICKLCPYACFSSTQAKTHTKLHKGKKYSCDACGKDFSMPNSLLQHKRFKHPTNCVCEFCGDAFATSTGLVFHKRITHKLEINNKQGPYCEDCDIHFANDMAWNKHTVLQHSVSNGCKHCGEMFTNEEELKSHSKVHRDTREKISQKFPVACILCKKMLSNSKEFKSHMTSKHPQSDAADKVNETNEKGFACETCGKAFSKPWFLKIHQRVHTGERPYACEDCGKTFTQPSSLAAHRESRHLRLRHTCRVCRRSYTHRTNLHKHMKIHLNIRPHKCTICGKGFINPSSRNVHIRHTHNNVPWPKKKDKSK